MIKRILLIFTTIFILSNIVVMYITPDFKPLRTLWQQNIVNAEIYLYDIEKPEIVIVGSSLSTCLNEEYLDKKYYNLALSGISAYDGMEIIRKSRKFPKILLIEANHAERTINPQFQNAVFHDFKSVLKPYLPILQTRHHIINNYILPSIPFIAKLITNKNHVEISTLNEKRNEQVYRLRQQAAIEEFQNNSIKNLDEKFHYLSNFLKECHEHKCKVIFLQVPMDIELYNTKLYNSNLNFIKQNFQSQSIIFPIPEGSFKTTDGKHLTKSSAKKYCKILDESIQNLLHHPDINSSHPLGFRTDLK